MKTYSNKEILSDFGLVLDSNSADILNVASSVLSRSIQFRLSKQDKLRLLNFRTWGEKLSLSITEMLQVLFPIWKDRFTKNKYGLGVPVSTLVGPKSKKILEDYVKRKYPNKENKQLIRQKLLDMLLPIPSEEEYEDITTFVEEYKKRIKVLRVNDTKSLSKFKRRRWRGNPVR